MPFIPTAAQSPLHRHIQPGCMALQILVQIDFGRGDEWLVFGHDRSNVLRHAYYQRVFIVNTTRPNKLVALSIWYRPAVHRL